MKYSVIAKRDAADNTYFIVPMEKEDDFVDMDCDTGVYEYAPLGIMLAVTKVYTDMAAGKETIEQEQFIIQTQHPDLEKGMLAKVILKDEHQ